MDTENLQQQTFEKPSVDIYEWKPSPPREFSSPKSSLKRKKKTKKSPKSSSQSPQVTALQLSPRSPYTKVALKSPSKSPSKSSVKTHLYASPDHKHVLRPITASVANRPRSATMTHEDVVKTYHDTKLHEWSPRRPYTARQPRQQDMKVAAIRQENIVIIPTDAYSLKFSQNSNDFAIQHTDRTQYSIDTQTSQLTINTNQTPNNKGGIINFNAKTSNSSLDLLVKQELENRRPISAPSAKHAKHAMRSHTFVLDRNMVKLEKSRMRGKSQSTQRLRSQSSRFLTRFERKKPKKTKRRRSRTANLPRHFSAKTLYSHKDSATDGDSIDSSFDFTTPAFLKRIQSQTLPIDKKPITVVKNRTAQGTFMIQSSRSSQSSNDFSNSDIDKENIPPLPSTQHHLVLEKATKTLETQFRKKMYVSWCVYPQK